MASFLSSWEPASRYCRQLQERVCAELELLEPAARFREERWARDGGGGGDSRLLVEGDVLEKAGVNFSDVCGRLPGDLGSQLPGTGNDFAACGVSVVLHPRSPMIPAVHANFRHIQKGDASWFGGGSDLTPFYPYSEDAIHFHRTWRRTCQAHPAVADYDRFKQWCDEYFYLPHRGEARGVGGIFFDYLTGDRDLTLAFVRDCGDAFLGAYLPIVSRRLSEPYSERERIFQAYRRGRYVEFNLLYDRGTLFGLKTSGRTDSILMSLPPVARWPGAFDVVAGSREAALADFLRPRNWADAALESG